MSVVVLMIAPDEYAMMGCDGVASHPTDGSVVGYASKITLMPEFNAVMGVTGVMGLAQMMQLSMPSSVTNFDQLVENLPVMMWDGCQKLSKLYHQRPGKSCAVVAGWSDARQKYEGWRITNYDKPMRMKGSDTAVETLPSYTERQIGSSSMWASAGPSEAILRRFGVIDGPEGMTDLDLVRRMICAARADSGATCEEYDHYNAGGFIQIAMLQKGYVQSAINHRWTEDVIGEPIDPARGQPMPDDLMAHYDAQA